MLSSDYTPTSTIQNFLKKEFGQMDGPLDALAL